MIAVMVVMFTVPAMTAAVAMFLIFMAMVTTPPTAS